MAIILLKGLSFANPAPVETKKQSLSKSTIMRVSVIWLQKGLGFDSPNPGETDGMIDQHGNPRSTHVLQMTQTPSSHGLCDPERAQFR